jgi:hypothetical protein
MVSFRGGILKAVSVSRIARANRRRDSGSHPQHEGLTPAISQISQIRRLVSRILLR